MHDFAVKPFFKSVLKVFIKVIEGIKERILIYVKWPKTFTFVIEKYLEF